MKRYINGHEKAMIACVSGCIGVLEDMIRIGFPCLLPVMPRIKTCKTHLQKVLEATMVDVDEDQLVGILNWVNNAEIMVMPKTDVRAQKELLVVDGNVVERIVKNSICDCGLCFKDETAVKQCQLRKDLLALGIMPKQDRRGVCPYQP